MRNPIIILLCAGLLLTTACQPSFEPISYGKDACASCKMTIVDRRFSAELLTAKGRVYKFDDILCMQQYMDGMQKQDEQVQLFVADYLDNGEAMLDARKAVFLRHELFASPMNGNCAAFASRALAQQYRDSLHTDFQHWNTLRQ
ncbi:nitrous oxide reductase accessory protein NosL [Chitinophaga japonensis]|uniref:Copper chaperone NosL n=1 Tax=Chitinophaga japonensis TaxID=104662 RepID=A0A562SMK7_CHIJA|nr:nitrous oxide reductase accessory protein NosL [Chitinophaga japonensis]TWI82537.1 copper chaperone NosL [Chitinophaga japonensis]